MKMNKTKEMLLRLLAALTFATATLAAVHSLTFAWLVGFVYRSNIRGYVPAGLTGMMLLGLATLLLVFRLAALARRRQDNPVPYVAVGCLAAPTAIVGFSVYTGLLIGFLGEYSWQKDVTMSGAGGAGCTLMAIIFHRLWLSKKADNHTSEGIRQPADGSTKPSM
jgi:hypothetical protein